MPRPTTLGASSLAETLVAIALSSVLLLGLSALHGSTIKLAQRQKDTEFASVVLQERLDQMRLLTWDRLCTPSEIQSHLSTTSKVPTLYASLGTPSEAIALTSVNPLSVTGTPATNFTVTHYASGVVSANSSTAIDSTTAYALQVDATVSWVAGSAPHTRGMRMIVTKKGLGR